MVAAQQRCAGVAKHEHAFCESVSHRAAFGAHRCRTPLNDGLVTARIKDDPGCIEGIVVGVIGTRSQRPIAQIDVCSRNEWIVRIAHLDGD